MENEEMANALNGIMSNNINISGLFEELADDVEKDISESEHVCLNKTTSWICPSYEISIDCVNMIVDCVQSDQRESMIYLLPNELEQINKAVTTIENTPNNKLAFDEFLNILCSQKNVSFPLELICLLHKSGILALDEYLERNVNNSTLISQFQQSVVMFFRNPDFEKENTKWMASTTMLSLVKCALAETETNSKPSTISVRKVCHFILDSLIKKVIALAINDTSIQITDSINMISSISELPGVNLTLLTSVANYTFVEILSHNPKIKISQAFSEQSQWLYKLSSPYFVSVLQNLMIILEPEQIITSLQNCLQNREVNWRALLTAISTFLVCRRKAYQLLLDLIELLLKEAFGKYFEESLVCGFLLARQASIEDLPFCLSYANWLQKYFGKEVSSLANTPLAFAFLQKFLINLVPIEPQQFLKAHISSSIYIPPKCRIKYNEYMTLAKTRLKDLRKPNEESGIYQSVQFSKIENKVQDDVQKAVELYQNLGKVPESVVEASIFKKPYFITRFLPVLLESRLLSDIPDAKAKLVEDLKEMNKIPGKMFEDYKASCKKVADKLFEEIEMVDELFDNFIIEPQEELKQALESFYHDLSKSQTRDIYSLSTQLSSKLRTVIEALQLPENISLVESQFYFPNVGKKRNVELQAIAKQLVDCFCLCHQLFSKNPLIISDTEWASWDYLYVSMMGCYKHLKEPLFNHLWDLITKEVNGLNLKEETIDGLGQLIYHVDNIFGSSVTKPECNDETLPFSSVIFHFLKTTNRKEIDFYITLGSKYLKAAQGKQVPLKLDTLFSKKFQFLVLCQIFSSRNNIQRTEQNSSLAILQYKTEAFQNAILNNKLSFQDCISFESDITQEAYDHDERQDRLEDWYNSDLIKNAETDLNIKKQISIIFDNVINNAKAAAFFSLLNLLQTVIHQLIGEQTIPWLQEELQKHIGCIVNDADNSIWIENKLQHFLRIAISLPPYLFLCDKPSDIVTKESISGFVEIVTKFLKQFATKNSFLPKKLTIHFCQAMTQCRNSDFVFEQLMERAPLLIASIVYHWPLQLSFNSPCKLNICLSEISLIFSAIKYAHKDSSGLSLPATRLSGCFVGVMLYQHGGLLLIQKALAIEKPQTEICCYALHCFITEKAHELLNSKIHFLNPIELKQLVSLPISLLKLVSEELPALLLKIYPQMISIAYPAAYLNLLLQLWDSNLIESLSIDTRIVILSLILENLTKCNERHDNWIMNCEERYTFSLSNSVFHLIDVNTKICAILKSVPIFMLQGLTLESIQKSDPHIQMIINYRKK